jgi:mRNA interferase HigB
MLFVSDLVVIIPRIKNSYIKSVTYNVFPKSNQLLDNVLGIVYILAMRIIAKRTLRAFWIRYPDAEEPLLAWYREVEKADWEEPAQVKEKYRSASFVKGNRVIFNIKGNDYRLIVKINYEYRVVYVRFVGTHAEYDEIDAKEV